MRAKKCFFVIECEIFICKRSSRKWVVRKKYSLQSITLSLTKKYKMRLNYFQRDYSKKKIMTISWVIGK